MESLGEFLKNRRTSSRKSVLDLATSTKIGASFLEAIEADDWSRFSSEVIARGFVRSYGMALGLDPEDVLHRFDETVHPVYREKEASRQSYKDQVVKVKPQEANRKAVGQVASTAVVIMILITLYVIGSHRLNRPAPVEEPATPAAGEAMEQEMPVPSAAIQEAVPHEEAAPPPPAAARPAPARPAPAVPPPLVPSSNPPVTPPRETAGAAGQPKALTLSMEALDTSWVSIRIDDQDPKEVLLKPGEKIAWKADRQFALDLGNAGGALFKLNGEPLEPFGPPGAVMKNIVLTADALPGETPSEP